MPLLAAAILGLAAIDAPLLSAGPKARCQGVAATIAGSAGADRLRGGPGQDRRFP